MTRQPAGASVAPHQEAALAELEAAVGAVTQALVGGDVVAVEVACARLLAASRAARDPLARARSATVRERLARASAQLAAQREAIARAAAAVDRATAVLLPPGGDAYGASGTGPRAASTGSLVA
jgi:hypothetical protein